MMTIATNDDAASEGTPSVDPKPGESGFHGVRTTRERLLETAYDAFAADGFDGASVRQICGSAGVSVAVLNYHFRSKDHLWVAACERASAFFAAVVADNECPSAGETLRRSVEALMAALGQDPRPMRIVRWALVQRGTPRPRDTAAAFRPLVDRVGQLADGLRAETAPRPRPASPAASPPDAEIQLWLLFTQLEQTFGAPDAVRSYFGADLSSEGLRREIGSAILDQIRRWTPGPP